MKREPRRAIMAYCSGCHRSGRSGFDFTNESLTLDEMQSNRSTWEDAVRKLRAHEMPPRRFPQPPESVREALILWIEQTIQQPANTTAAPRTYTRRLQRSEYVNSIRDLLGVRYAPSDDFPKDAVVWSRTTDKEAFALLKDKYREAAERILEQAFLAKLDGPEDGINSLERAVIPLHLYASNTGNRIDMDQTRAHIAEFTRLAYRSPVDPAETERLVALAERAEREGKPIDECLKMALREVLTSENFLCRVETANHPNDQSRQLALASRLAFFLWRSAPDEKLLRLAEHELLAENLEAQVQRMLQDPRSRALAVDFAAAWLGLGSKDDQTPELDEPLRRAMRLETEHFATAILREDRSVLDFLDADFTFVNGRLAKHYGIPGIRGDQMQRVPLQGTPRGGLVTQGSILTLTSMGGRTSPALRGKWVMENLLGAAPMRPPPGATQAFDEISNSFPAGLTVPQRMEAHRANPGCAQCHVKMDIIGLTLENFNQQGAWRTTWGKDPIVPQGELPDGEILNGPAGLKGYLLKHRAEFVRGFSAKLLQFALGRKLDDRDRKALEPIPEAVAKDQFRIARVIQEVVLSEPFRRGFGSHPNDAKIGLAE